MCFLCFYSQGFCLCQVCKNLKLYLQQLESSSSCITAWNPPLPRHTSDSETSCAEKTSDIQIKTAPVWTQRSSWLYVFLRAKKVQVKRLSGSCWPPNRHHSLQEHLYLSSWEPQVAFESLEQRRLSVNSFFTAYSISDILLYKSLVLRQDAEIKNLNKFNKMLLKCHRVLVRLNHDDCSLFYRSTLCSYAPTEFYITHSEKMMPLFSSW